MTNKDLGKPEQKIELVKYYKPPSGAPQYFPSEEDRDRLFGGAFFESCIGFDNVEKEIGCLPDMIELEFINDKFKRVIPPQMKPDGKEAEPSEFMRELSSVINRFSKENGSNTPDFILAEYLNGCLDSFNKASRSREKWFGKELKI